MTSDEALKSLRFMEYAGRTCYDSKDKMDSDTHEKFLKNLIKRGHGSPLEFADMTVEFITSRDVLAELTRHRLCNFCVESQRYVLKDKEGDIVFIKPLFYDNPSEEVTEEVVGQETAWEAAMRHCEAMYKTMIGYGAKPQDARKVLPNSTSCKIVMKANIREWRHVINLRSSPAAYPEMRDLMDKLMIEINKLYPEWLFEDVYHK